MNIRPNNRRKRNNNDHFRMIGVVATLLLFLLVGHASGARRGALYKESTEKSDILRVRKMVDWQNVEKSSKLWIVQLYRDDCSYCRAFEPEFSKVAENLRGLIGFAVVNMQRNTELGKLIADKYGLPWRAVPSVYSFRPMPDSELAEEKTKTGKQQASSYGISNRTSLSKRPRKVAKFDGPRKADALRRFAFQRMPEAVELVSAESYEKFATSSESPKVLYFPSLAFRGVTPPVLRSLSTEFSGRLVVGRASAVDDELAARFDIDRRPALFFNNPKTTKSASASDSGARLRTWVPYDSIGPYGLSYGDVKAWLTFALERTNKGFALQGGAAKTVVHEEL